MSIPSSESQSISCILSTKRKHADDPKSAVVFSVAAEIKSLKSTEGGSIAQCQFPATYDESTLSSMGTSENCFSSFRPVSLDVLIQGLIICESQLQLVDFARQRKLNLIEFQEYCRNICKLSSIVKQLEAETRMLQFMC